MKTSFHPDACPCIFTAELFQQPKRGNNQAVSIPGDWTEFPLLHRRISWLIHSPWHSLHLRSRNSPSSPLPPPPPSNHKSVLCVSLFLLVPYFRFHVEVISYCLCLWLTSLRVRLSSCIHVAANGIFFSWLSGIPLCIRTTSSESIHLSMDI